MTATAETGDYINRSTFDHEVSIYYQNARGLRTKTTTFYIGIASSRHQVVAVTETWTTPDISNSELFPPCYTVNRDDRDVEYLSRGGGVLLATRDDVKAVALDMQHIRSAVPLINIVGSRLTFSDETVIYVFVIYISPSVSFDDLALFFDELASLNYVYSEKILILGDFNIPSFADPPGDRSARLLGDYQELLNLDQYNHVLNCNSRLLDLIFASFACSVIREDDPMIPEDSHHPTLLVSFRNAGRRLFPATRSESGTFNFRKANFPLLYESLCLVDWSTLSGLTDANAACLELYSNLNSVFRDTVPCFKSTGKRQFYPPWFSSEVIHLLRRKRKARKSFKSTQNPHHRENFRALRSSVKAILRRDYFNFVRDAGDSLASEPRRFWSYVRDKKGRSGTPSFVRDDAGVEYGSAKSIADAFAVYFSSVFTLSDAPRFSVDSDLGDAAHGCIRATPVTDEDIIRAVKRLGNNMTAGEDMIPSFFVRDCSGILVEPLKHLFNLILSTGTFPEVWKRARVFPVLKKGDPTLLKNYRPISILSNFAKLFEIVLYDQIYPLVKSHISPLQHGFMERRSTVTNLAVFSQYVSEVLDSRGQVDVIYTDISKAFDQIDHNLLMCKLNALGFSAPLLRLFQSYLSGRVQRVSYAGVSSESYFSTSGVPQGANWGPLLFLIFFNDIVETISRQKLLFADDLKLYTRVDSVADCFALQGCIDSMSGWCRDNGLSLSVGKCVVVSFTRKTEPSIFHYTIGQAVLRRERVVRDLGVVFDAEFSFVDHVDDVVSSSLRTLGFIYRNCRDFKNAACLATLYRSFVRSKLEYASLIWFPIYRSHVARIESVQRRFLKFASFLLDGTYPPRGSDHRDLLSRHGFDLLETRHVVLCVKFLFGLLHNTVDCSELLSRINLLVPRLNARRSLTFYCDAPKSNALVRSPIYTVCNFFNIYCADCDVFFDGFKMLQDCIVSVINCNC